VNCCCWYCCCCCCWCCRCWCYRCCWWRHRYRNLHMPAPPQGTVSHPCLHRTVMEHHIRWRNARWQFFAYREGEGGGGGRWLRW
jgi:hypothetical protein